MFRLLMVKSPIKRDGIEDGIAEELVEAGIPRIRYCPGVSSSRSSSSYGLRDRMMTRPSVQAIAQMPCPVNNGMGTASEMFRLR